tara:strand:+ start:653 stop:754 length:102 start_codon:yes stop_codon:yes gene_type:complete
MDAFRDFSINAAFVSLSRLGQGFKNPIKAKIIF